MQSITIVNKHISNMLPVTFSKLDTNRYFSTFIFGSCFHLSLCLFHSYYFYLSLPFLCPSYLKKKARGRRIENYLVRLSLCLGLISPTPFDFYYRLSLCHSCYFCLSPLFLCLSYLRKKARGRLVITYFD